MRKYISFVALLVVTFAITSCELEGGTDPNPNRANQNLWNRVQYSLDSQYQYVAAVAHLNDTLRGVEDTNLFYQGCEIAKYEDTYTLYYSGQNCTYKIVTAGTLLSEGGEWAVYAKYGSYMGFKRMGKATGIVGDATKFVLELEDTEGVSFTYYDILKSEVAYSLNSSEGCLDVTYNSVEGYSTERHDSEPDYSIEFKLVEPMVLCDGIKQSGEVYIHYKDYVLHTERALKVKIANKFITFAPLN